VNTDPFPVEFLECLFEAEIDFDVRNMEGLCEELNVAQSRSSSQGDHARASVHLNRHGAKNTDLVLRQGHGGFVESEDSYGLPRIKYLDRSSVILTVDVVGDVFPRAEPGEYLVQSDIITGITGINAEIRYSTAVKVESWGKACSVTEKYERNGKKYQETLRVTLTPVVRAKELNADYEHTVLEDGQVILRFSGMTVLRHWTGD